MCCKQTTFKIFSHLWWLGATITSTVCLYDLHVSAHTYIYILLYLLYGRQTWECAFCIQRREEIYWTACKYAYIYIYRDALICDRVKLVESRVYVSSFVVAPTNKTERQKCQVCKSYYDFLVSGFMDLRWLLLFRLYIYRYRHDLLTLNHRYTHSLRMKYKYHDFFTKQKCK